MGFNSSGDTIVIKAYLTQKGRELYFLGDDEDIIAKYFTLSDSDTNYFISSSINTITELSNTLQSGFVPSITGDDDGCVLSVTGGYDLKYPMNVNIHAKGNIVTSYCQSPYTLIQEISNGDSTTYFTKTENSIFCGFYYKSNTFSKSFVKQTCSGSSIGQSYTVTTSVGQFTGSTQDEADNKALTYVNTNGQILANSLGSCMFQSDPQQQIFTKNDCSHGGRDYVVSTTQGQFTSLVDQTDANNKALLYLANNGQTIANVNSSCKVLIGTTDILKYNPSQIQFTRNKINDYIGTSLDSNGIYNFNSSNGYGPLSTYTLNLILAPNNLNNKDIKLKLFGTAPTSGNLKENLLSINRQNNTPVSTYTLVSSNVINNIQSYELDITITNYQDNEQLFLTFSNLVNNSFPNFQYAYRIEVYEIISIYQ